MINKPNQHYVYQKYLEPWTYNGQIWTLRNRSAIFPTATRNIASKRFFYSIDGLDMHDVALIHKLFVDSQPPDIKRLLNGWIEPLIPVLKLLEGNPLNEKQRELTELHLRNLLENNLYMNVESNGLPGLEKLQSGDAAFLYNNRNSMDNFDDVEFINYLSYQYFRTKNIRESVKNSIDKSLFHNFDAAFNIIVPIFATLFGNSIAQLISVGKHKCFCVKASDDVEFITGDQPVINLAANMIKKNDVPVYSETKELELYYPVSPQYALLITNTPNIDTQYSVEQVIANNNIIAEHSLELIFAGNEVSLDAYKK